MNTSIDGVSGRIILIDDNPAIHQNFKKIFGSGLRSAAALSASDAALFGGARSRPTCPVFEIDFALQGQHGVELVRRALDEERPYAMAFVDLRMPTGWE